MFFRGYNLNFDKNCTRLFTGKVLLIPLPGNDILRL